MLTTGKTQRNCLVYAIDRIADQFPEIPLARLLYYAADAVTSSTLDNLDDIALEIAILRYMADNAKD